MSAASLFYEYTLAWDVKANIITTWVLCQVNPNSRLLLPSKAFPLDNDLTVLLSLLIFYEN